MARVRSRIPAGAIFALAALAINLGPGAPAHAFTQRGVGVVTALRGVAAVAHAPDVAAR